MRQFRALPAVMLTCLAGCLAGHIAATVPLAHANADKAIGARAALARRPLRILALGSLHICGCKSRRRKSKHPRVQCSCRRAPDLL